MARLAPALVTIRAEINTIAPNRDKTSDGWIGDAAHSARDSDHNPNAQDIVCAIDVDEDGIDCPRLAEELRAMGAAGDKRVGYVIYEGRIAGPASRGWAWRKYTGTNAHTQHLHLSTSQTASVYNSTASWGVLAGTAAAASQARSSAGRRLPAFPLPAGHWFGVQSKDPRNHSGYAAADRPHIVALLDAMRARGWRDVPRTDRYTQEVADLMGRYQDDGGLRPVDKRTGKITWESVATSGVR